MGDWLTRNQEGRGGGPWFWLGYQGIARFGARPGNTTNVVEMKD